MNNGFRKKIVAVFIPHLILESQLSKAEAISNPALVVSGTSPKSTVLDYSPGLEKHGIRKEMHLHEVKLPRHNLSLLPIDYDSVECAHNRVISQLASYSPLVESESPGHYFFDLTGTERLFGRALETCGRVIQDFRKLLRLTACMGIGSNPLLARMAAQLAGYYGVYHILARDVIDRLSIWLLPKISRKSKEELISSYNIQSIGELSLLTKDDLICLFGGDGKTLWRWSRGMASDTVNTVDTVRASISERSIKKDVAIDDGHDDNMVRRSVFRILSDACTLMREESVFPQSILLTIIYQDNHVFTHHAALKQLSYSETILYEQLVVYVSRALRRRVRIKRVKLVFSRFTSAFHQPELFPELSKQNQPVRAYDSVRKRFGRRYLRRGA